MRWLATMMVLLGVAGCATTEPRFMGLTDGQSQTMRDRNPQADPRLAGITTISPVRQVPWEEYQQRRRNNAVARQEPIDGWLYFAVEQRRDVPFPEGGSAWVEVVERYKTRPR